MKRNNFLIALALCAAMQPNVSFCMENPLPEPESQSYYQRYAPQFMQDISSSLSQKYENTIGKWSRRKQLLVLGALLTVLVGVYYRNEIMQLITDIRDDENKFVVGIANDHVNKNIVEKEVETVNLMWTDPTFDKIKEWYKNQLQSSPEDKVKWDNTFRKGNVHTLFQNEAYKAAVEELYGAGSNEGGGFTKESFDEALNRYASLLEKRNQWQALRTQNFRKGIPITFDEEKYLDSVVADGRDALVQLDKIATNAKNAGVMTEQEIAAKFSEASKNVRDNLKK